MFQISVVVKKKGVYEYAGTFLLIGRVMAEMVAEARVEILWVSHWYVKGISIFFFYIQASLLLPLHGSSELGKSRKGFHMSWPSNTSRKRLVFVFMLIKPGNGKKAITVQLMIKNNNKKY